MLLSTPVGNTQPSGAVFANDLLEAASTTLSFGTVILRECHIGSFQWLTKWFAKTN